VGIEDLGRVDGVSPGILSSGLGEVRPAQTYLDISQGTRLFETLYPEPLPLLYTGPDGVPLRLWRRVEERAREAPAEIVPGLLASTIADAGESGMAMRASPRAGLPALAAVDRDGRLVESELCAAGGCGGVTVISTRLADLDERVRRLREDDLLIAIERPLPRPERLLSVGIAGRGFDGTLTSDSTRLRGLVLSTDLAPTVLERLGIAVPAEVAGRAIRTEGRPDAAAVASLERRLEKIGPRREPVILESFLIWLALSAVAALAFGGRGARRALPLLMVSSAYLPVLLLLTAAINPSEVVERLVVGAGAPALATLTLALLRPYAALAVACAVTVLAHAVDVIVGSPLTAVSLLGPSPGLGVRFFGIGNELEATLGMLVLIGAGAGLAARGDGVVSPRTAAIVFATAAAAAVAAFAPGRFGADVGMAIALPVGAAVAIAVAVGARRRAALLIAAAPLLALVLVVVADLALGGGAHLSRSVLEAGGLDEVADVAQRRITLSEKSFDRNLDSPYFLAVIALIVLGIARREALLGWFGGRRLALAGFLGGAATTVLGTLANDSGAQLLMVGTAYLAMFVGLAWAVSGAARGEGPHPPGSRAG
jgi:hypothetical protein